MPKSTLILILAIVLGLPAQATLWEEQILEVITTNGTVLTEPILAYTNQESVYLPLLDLAKILGLPIEQPSARVYKISLSPQESKTLHLDVCLATPTPECEAQFQRGGIDYLRLSYLQESLKWPINVDLKAMQLLIQTSLSPSEPAQNPNRDSHPYLIQRDWLSKPSAKVEAVISSAPSNNLINILQTQPFLLHDSDLLFSSGPQWTHWRWTLSKELFDSKSPGAIKNYELISTQTLDTKFLLLPTPITGVRFSNIKMDEHLFETQNFAERGPPRWRVQLYVNEIFQGETIIDNNGYYYFNNIPIFYGENRLLFRLTSPMGKVVENEKKLNISRDFQGHGKIKYQAAFGQRVGDSKMIGSAIINYGLSSSLSAQGGYAQLLLPTDTKEKQYSYLGANYLHSKVSMGVLKIASLNQEEHSLVFSTRWNAEHFLLNGEFAQFDNFHTSVINPRPDDSIRSTKQISLLANLPLGLPVATQIGFREQLSLNGSPDRSVQSRNYAVWKNNSFLLETETPLSGPQSNRLYLEFGKYRHDFRGRLGAVLQDARYSKTRTTLEVLLRDRWYVTVSAEIAKHHDESAYVLGASKVISDIQTELNVSHSALNTTAALVLSTNFLATPSGYTKQSETSQRHARIELLAFVDENGNGIYDASEKLMAGLQVIEEQSQKVFTTDSQGLIHLNSLPPYERVSFRVIKESIPNVYLTARDFEHDFVLTPGQFMRLEIPIQTSYDLRGVMKNYFYKKLVPLELLDDQLNVLMATTSGAAGNYKFSDLPAGTYWIRVNPQFLEQNRLTSEPKILGLQVTGKAGLRTLQEMIITPISPR